MIKRSFLHVIDSPILGAQVPSFEEGTVPSLENHHGDKSKKTAVW
jgi:hypothetical protein